VVGQAHPAVVKMNQLLKKQSQKGCLVMGLVPYLDLGAWCKEWCLHRVPCILILWPPWANLVLLWAILWWALWDLPWDHLSWDLGKWWYCGLCFMLHIAIFMYFCVTGYILHRIGTSGRLLWTWHCTLRCDEMRGISCPSWVTVSFSRRNLLPGVKWVGG
jgi:hypothetical protein